MHLQEYVQTTGISDSFREAVALFYGAVSALEEALSHGSYHSRLSPASFQIAGNPADGVLFLTDPEMIRPTEGTSGEFPIWPFAAPEQTGLVEGPVGVASNIYTLGVIGSYLFGSSPRLLSLSGIELAEAIVRDGVEPRYRSAVGEEQRSFCTRIIRRATAKNPVERYPDLAELKAELSVLMSTRQNAETPAAPILVGRENERKVIGRFLDGIRNGEGRFLLLTGEPGQGKSFLWSSVSEAERRSGEAWCFYKSPQTGTVPYAGAASLVRQLITASRTAADGAPQLQSILAGKTLDIVETISPGMVQALGYEPAAPEVSRRNGLTEETHHELVRLFNGLAGQFSVVVIAVDDIQWLDPQSRNVLGTLSLEPPPGCGIAFLGRPEALDILPTQLLRDNTTLGGLSEDEATRLLGRSHITEINRYAQGNPLALIQLGKSLVASTEQDGETTINFGEPQDTKQLLEVLAHSRLKVLGAEARELLQFLSLLLPPAPVDYLRRSARFEPETLEVLVEECRAALLLSPGGAHDPLYFSHDSVETLTREEAEAKPELVQAAVGVLRDASQSGDDRALFALSHLVADGAADRPGTYSLSDSAAGTLLTRAAKRALEFRSATEALRFAEAALRMGLEADDPLLLRMIAHEAAYQLDDVAAMSRHFAHIYASGDRLAVNRARLLWISHSYAASAFRGALRIAWRALEDLGAMSAHRDDAALLEEARAYLHRVRLAPLVKELLSRPITKSAATRLRVSVVSRIILSVLSVDQERLAIAAYLVIRECLENGRTPETGVAFIAWSQLEASRGITPRRVAALLTAATRLADSVDDPVSRHAIHTYAELFDLPWTRPYEVGMQRVQELHREGIELGNFQFASHAAHIHVQALFYHGTPLEEVFDAIQTARSQMEGYYHHRTSRALAKYAQAVESLLGRTSDPLALTGSIIEETAYMREAADHGDALSLHGLRILKGFLAMYFGRPDFALRQYEATRTPGHAIGSLHDAAVFHFLWGLASYRQGDVTGGREALGRLRRWARAAPENHLHRVYALAAEEAFSRGRPRRGRALYEKARHRAMARNYRHEAALIAEYHTHHLRSSPGEESRMEELLYLAHGLYTRWGAVHAAERIRNELGWYRSLPSLRVFGLENSFVRRLVEARTSDELLRRTTESLFRFSGAWRAVLVLDMPGLRQAVTTRSGDIGEAALVTTVDEHIHPSMGRLLEDMPAGNDGQIRSISIGDAPHSVYSVDSPAVEGTSLRFFLISAPGGGSFSQVIRARVAAGVTLAGALLQLRRVLLRNREQAVDLADARQAVARAEDYRKTLFGAINDGLLLLRSDLSILYHNEGAGAFLEAGDGKSAVLAPEISAAVSHAVARGDDAAAFAEVELPWRQQQLRISVTSAPSPDEPDSEIYAVSIRDITEATRRDEALRRREQQLIVADRMSSLGMLSATIAHEVSNPNHILQLNAQSLMVLLGRLRDQASADGTALEEAEGVVGQILEGASRIEQVVGRVKEYGRSGGAEEAEVVSVGDICERALRFSRIMAAQYTNHLTYEPRSDIPRFRAVGGLLEQAIINLIKNACEALHDSSGRVRLATDYDTLSGEVIISVADDGPGIDPTVRERLGEPFQSGRRGEGGTGLGLSIVQTILEKHQGRLRLHDDSDYATVAELRVPAESAATVDRRIQH